MKTPVRITEQQGSVVLIALIILVLLTVLGISATSTTDMELQMVRNVNEYRRNFYVTEGGGIEVAYDIYHYAPGRDCSAVGNRTSCGEAYVPRFADQPIFLTETLDGDSLPNPDDTKVKKYWDPTWHKNNETQPDEYAYRVYFRGAGPPIKSFGSDFTSYLFEVSTRKQTTATAGTDPDPVTMTTIVTQGFLKPGPKMDDL